MANLQETLATLLAPQGIKTVTTGNAEIAAYYRARFGTSDIAAVEAAWRDELRRARDARAVIIGVPMDCGAGFERGSFKGPLGIRTALYSAAGLAEALHRAGVVDLGDVRVNPHVVDDSYYTEEFLDRIRTARGWPGDAEPALPVAPHSVLRRVLELLARPDASSPRPGPKVLVLGGDHSLSRLPVEVLARPAVNPHQDLGVLHFDAHTDLLDYRDGVPYNFATWAYHANEAIGRRGRLVQVGVRVSGRPAAEWESDYELRQIRMSEIDDNGGDWLVDEVCNRFHDAGVRRIYISNDIDATDPTYAASTGTMEAHGLMPDMLLRVLREVSARFEIVGSDLVEVAPPLKWHVPGEPARTIRTASRYVLAQLETMLGEELPRPFDDGAPADESAVLAFPPYC